MKTNIVATLACLFLAVGCAHGSVTEKAPVTQDLGAFHTASIVVTVAPGVENPDAFKGQLTAFIETRLKEKNLFAELVPEGGELSLKIHITKLDKPMSIAGIPGGESDAAASVELVDTKAAKTLGAFDATGTSKRNTSTSVRGVSTTAGDDPRKRALESTADQIVAYVESHRGAHAK